MNKKTENQSRMMILDRLVESIGYRSQLISRSQKLDSGITATRFKGFIVGFITAIALVLIIPLTVWYFIGII